MSEQAVADEIERILERGREGSAAPVDGTCQDCGQPIGDERLAALPTATRCVRCQAEWEQGPGRR
jgi:phage/conjugal plasmid C-4 type zinc finger TraR family protein